MSLHFDITGDNSNFLRKLDEARNGVRTTSKQIEESGTSIEQMFGRMAKGAAAFGTGFTAKELISSIVRVRGQFQQLDVAFTTLLQSKEKANALMAQMVQTAAKTPFNLTDLATGAKQLVAYGFASEGINDSLIRLGNIASGLGLPLERLTYLYGTTMTQGRLYTRDLMQFTTSGIPMLQGLADMYGVSTDKVNEMVTAGKVGFPEVQKVIENLTNEGGKFFNLMEEQSKTITGKISNLGDAWDTMLNKIGESQEGIINSSIDGLKYLIENYEAIGKTILELAATYGVYKAILMSVAAYQSFAVGVTYTAEIAELSKLIPLKQQSANEDVIAAVASGKLTQSKAAQVIALRAEISAKIQSLQATEAQTKAEYASAMASYKNATQRMLLAKQNMAIAQSQMSIAIKSGTIEEIAAAKKNAQTASLELNNAAVAKNTAHKSVNIAATNSKSASEALNTVQTGLNTVSQNTNTVSTNILTAAKTKLAAASKALGLSMLANPYVLVAAAVAGLAYGIYKLATAETVAEKAARQHREEQEKFQKTIDERKQRIEELIRIIQDETETEYAKAKAYDELQKLSPALTSAYTREQLAVASLTDTNKKLNEEIDKNNYDNIISNVNKYTETLSKARKEAERLREDAKNEKDPEKAANLSNLAFGQDMATANAERNLSQWQKDLDEYNRIKKEAEENAKPVEVKLLEAQSSRDQIVQEYAAAKLTLEEEQRKIQESGFGVIPVDVQIRFDNAEAQLANIDNTIASLMQGNTTQTYKEAYDTAKKEWKAAQKALEESKKKSKADYDKAKKDLDEKEKSYKDLGGITGSSLSKQESAADKLRKEQEKYNLLLDQQKREAARMKTDSQHELEQIEINGLAEGSEKVLRQRKLNHEKELVAIKREAEDKKLQEIEKARSAHESNPDSKKGTFDADKFVKSEPAKKQFTSFDKTAEAKTKTENTRYNRGDDFKGLLDEYQDYADKRFAIETKFNNDIATLEEQRKTALKNGDTKQVEEIDRAKAQATAEKGKSLMAMDYDKLKESPDYARAFENLKETSSETLNSLLSQLENAKGAAAKVLSPDQLREYTTTIQEIMDELDARNPFQSLSDKKQELADAEQELADAQMALENARQTADAVKGGAKIENGVKSSKFNQKTGKIDSTKDYLSEAQALDRVKDKTDNYNDAKDKTVKKSAQVQKAEKKVKDVIGDLSDSLKGLGSALGGQAGEIINLIGDIGNFAMMAMSGVQGASTTASKAIQTVEKASVILAIISAAVQIATKIFDMFGKDTTTEKYEDAKEAYESYINILDRVIDKQLELAESLSGENANAAYEKAIEAIKEQSRNAKILGQQYLNSGASRKSHSKGYEEVDDMSWEGWNQAANALGMTIDQFKDKMGGRMTGLFDLTDEQLAILQTDAGIFWSQLDSDTQSYADQVANGVAKVAEVIEQRMTDVTLIDMDSLRSDFQDLLADLDSGSADFAGNFEEYMKNAIINSMLKESYMSRLEAWRKKFYAAMDGGVTEKEYDDLKDEGKRISDEMKAKQEAMKEMYGWESSESSSQSSTEKGFAAMSQDTGNELNGRFTALQISNEEIKNTMLLVLGNLSALSATSVDNNGILSDMRNLAVMSNSYLDDIARHTKVLLLFGEKLDKIESNTKGLSSR